MVRAAFIGVGVIVSVAVLAACAAARPLYANSAGPARLYVSPTGSDAWSGSLAKANARRSDGPLATIAGAQQAVRKLKAKGLSRPIQVVIQPGTYRLREPLTLTQADSGTQACPITFRAAEKGSVIISGGATINGWHKRAGALWAANVSKLVGGNSSFRLLRVGDRWAIRARHPNFDPKAPAAGGWLYAQWWGEPWERGAFGTGVANIHNAGDRLWWRIRVPADGTYRVWVRYGHQMRAFGMEGMSGRTALQVDYAAPVRLQNLPDTGGWDASRWSHSADLFLKKGERTLRWVNPKGGGLNLDAIALCDDEDWNPDSALTNVEWWSSRNRKEPAQGKHLLIVQAEACSKWDGREIVVPDAAPSGDHGFVCFAEGTLPRWKGVAGAEVHIFPAWGWVNGIVPVARVDWAERKIVFAGRGASQDVRMGNRFYIENVREALDAPGEWYLDGKAGRLFYMPENKAFPRLPVIAPRLDRLIELKGDPERGCWIEHVRFEGLTFTDTDYTLTDDYYTPADAAIRMSGARDCAVTDCEFRWLGGYALRLENRSQHIQFLCNDLHHLGQGGVVLLGDNESQPRHNIIVENTMRHLGLIYKHVAGVYATSGSDNNISRNTISDTSRYGISLKSYGVGSMSHRNPVELNDISRTNLETNDSGAVETFGLDGNNSDNIIRYNLILDSVGLGTTARGRILKPHFTWGIYLDDYSSGTIVYGNIVVGNANGGICVHGGKDNVIENNIFVDGSEEQIRLQPRDGFMRNNRFVRNIVVYSRPKSGLVFSWGDARDLFSEWDYNLYWLRGADLSRLNFRNTPAGTFAQWR